VSEENLLWTQRTSEGALANGKSGLNKLAKPIIGIAIFARMSSVRLPGKVLMDFGGKPLLVWIVERARASGLPICIATSREAADDAIERCARQHGINCFRGALEDVLSRAHELAQHFGWHALIRLCGDRPFFDLEEMLEACRLFEAEPGLQLISNQCSGPIAAGLTTELIARSALARILALDPDPSQREHLTQACYAHPGSFRLRALPRSAAASSAARFAIDSAADYRQLQALSSLGQHATPAQVLAALQ
jgi:spore coat polysaccharide biosynthesis protein SpsF